MTTIEKLTFMKPKYRVGQWVRFYQKGTLVIGVIQYIHETLFGNEYSTDIGAVKEKYIEEAR